MKYVTIREYFNAKLIDISKLEVRNMRSIGIRDHIVFKTGIVAQVTLGRRYGKSPNRLPIEAKLLNKRMGATVFTELDASRIVVENNNGNIIIHDHFGDVSVMWIMPIISKIVDEYLDRKNGMRWNWQFIGYSFWFNIIHLGNSKILRDLGTLKEMTGTQEEREELIKKIDNECTIDFLYQLKEKDQSRIIGSRGNILFFENCLNEVFSLNTRFIGTS